MTPKNILFIMCDQLRHDYLGCGGHPSLRTPHIDALAARGVNFTRAYVQSTICGPSRMSAYTGRYVSSHGSTQNGVPLRVGEPTMGDHLRAAGLRTALSGKTHMVADIEGMARLGIDPASVIGVAVSECGFEPFDRMDGLYPPELPQDRPSYETYLRENGFDGDDPWQDWAASAEDDAGERLNGWLLSHADKPARVPEAHSETTYTTRRGIDFIQEAEVAGIPWCLHLSYIKPHWPYIAPAPYHSLYGAQDVPPVVRRDAERTDPHPVYEAFMQERFARVFDNPAVRERVIPAYMGLIRQIDDQLGHLFAFMEEAELFDRTLIVFTSDHGDYLGDHWMGEKYLFHDCSARVPMIVVDPDAAADATRGTTCDLLVEMIDLAPTFLDFVGAAPKSHVLEGRSLLPLTRGPVPPGGSWRKVAVSEYDYAFDAARIRLGVAPADAWLTMLTDGRWKYVHAPGFRPMLYDLHTDPQELRDLGADPAHSAEIGRLRDAHFDWLRGLRRRITLPDAAITRDDDVLLAFDPALPAGILIGYWDEAELAEEQEKMAAALRGRRT